MSKKAVLQFISYSSHDFICKYLNDFLCSIKIRVEHLVEVMGAFFGPSLVVVVSCAYNAIMLFFICRSDCYCTLVDGVDICGAKTPPSWHVYSREGYTTICVSVLAAAASVI